MNDFVWMKNPKGREVEVLASWAEKLQGEGYSRIEQPIALAPKFDLDATIPQGQYPYGGYGRVIELLEKRIRFRPESNNKIYLGYPREIERKEGERLFLITAFEADKLPQDWKEKCRYFDVVIVPSVWCQKLFIESGVAPPVEMMIQGTDNFDLIKKDFSSPFRFLHYNAFSDDQRKGWDLAAAAFTNVFGRYEKVELILKARTHDNEKDIKSVSRKGNIKILVKNMNRREIESLQEDVHCLVFPSRGEGIGLPPIETMARGIPTIVTNATGMSESALFGIPLEKHTSVDAVYRGITWDGSSGQWVEPEKEELEEKMFYVYHNYQRVKADAMLKAPLLREKFNLDVMAKRFVDIISRYAR